MNAILINLGFVKIYWYSFILLIAFIIGGLLALKEAKRNNISKNFMYDMFFYLVPVSLIGARLYFVLFNLDYYGANLSSIFKVWEGGLAIHGGIIAGIIFVFYYTKKHKINTLKIMDILVISLILGQAIGRWGNFFNSEAHGPMTTLNYLQSLHLPSFIINGMKIEGVYYQPTFFYESVWCIIGFIILLLLRHLKTIKIGQIISSYFIWYGLGRLMIEKLRTDSLMLGNIKIAQLISILMIISGIFLFIIFKNNKYYNDIGDKNGK